MKLKKRIIFHIMVYGLHETATMKTAHFYHCSFSELSKIERMKSCEDRIDNFVIFIKSLE